MIQEVRITPLQIQISLSGDIYDQEARELRRSVVGYFDKGSTTISIDLSGVSYIDGIGLWTLLFLHQHALEKKGTLRIVGLQGDIKELFRLTEMDNKLDIGGVYYENSGRS